MVFVNGYEQYMFVFSEQRKLWVNSQTFIN